MTVICIRNTILYELKNKSCLTSDECFEKFKGYFDFFINMMIPKIFSRLPKAVPMTTALT
jgi:hypothetical protein